ncbi:type VII toxin-antitoxin system HepT family RNase toxin [Ornithinibacillus sp. 179-J 7C1 HS]|uniref:type VII toxin-antitoxin system HepT family RNase toxin n=1 Tax=Ornithinibacillus sp. 179-J 7C1 HS TaxID=3142384 RepID=UPI0039A07825
MYFVDRKKVEETLQFIEMLLEEYKETPFESYREKLALERLMQLLIESIIDVGNMMIDGFIMRDPGSYEDIIDILEDEKVIPESESKAYKAVVELRKMLVKDYLHVDHEKIYHVLSENKLVLDQFSFRIREYLKNELDVANAFTKE